MELLEELDKKVEELGMEKETRGGLEQEMAIKKIHIKGLEGEVAVLKDEMEQKASKAFLARQKEMESSSSRSAMNDASGSNRHQRGVSDGNGTDTKDGATESDGNVVMLQEELTSANEAIRDLKEILGKILSQNPFILEQVQMMDNNQKYDDILPKEQPQTPLSSSNNKSSDSALDINDTITATTVASNDADAGAGITTTSTTTSYNDTTPLFFAIEKQAELNTVREEISRLAALLGDAESAKMESYEAMEDMRLRMEDAESRLRRYKKLGSAASGARHHHRPNTVIGNSSGGRGYAGWRNSSLASAGDDADDGITSHGDSTLNLEYLKNIMLSYLNAKTLNEKKALVPVISAVLELTPDEAAAVMVNVEKSAGIDGVGASLFENIQNKGVVSGLFG